MNTIFLHRVTNTIATCVLLACAGTTAAQEPSAVKPLRLSDLASTPAPATQPTADSASGVSATTGEAAVPSTTEASAAVPATSRWAALPLPGAEKDTASVTQMGEVSGTGAQDVMQVGGGLAGVLLLIWVLRTLIRKSSGSGAARGLLARVRAPEGVASIMARYPVARGEHVVLLEVGRRILVVHQASGSMTTLSELTDRDEVADIRARITGEERVKTEESFAPSFEASLEADSKAASLEPVEGMPGFVAETVDLTQRKRSRLTGGAA